MCRIDCVATGGAQLKELRSGVWGRNLRSSKEDLGLASESAKEHDAKRTPVREEKGGGQGVRNDWIRGSRRRKRKNSFWMVRNKPYQKNGGRLKSWNNVDPNCWMSRMGMMPWLTLWYTGRSAERTVFQQAISSKNISCRKRCGEWRSKDSVGLKVPSASGPHIVLIREKERVCSLVINIAAIPAWDGSVRTRKLLSVKIKRFFQFKVKVSLVAEALGLVSNDWFATWARCSACPRSRLLTIKRDSYFAHNLKILSPGDTKSHVCWLMPEETLDAGLCLNPDTSWLWYLIFLVCIFRGKTIESPLKYNK